MTDRFMPFLVFKSYYEAEYHQVNAVVVFARPEETSAVETAWAKLPLRLGRFLK